MPVLAPAHGFFADLSISAVRRVALSLIPIRSETSLLGSQRRCKVARCSGTEMFTREESAVRLRLLIACVLCCLCATDQSCAWGPAGHKIIASIALRQLAPEKQAKVVALLKQHPRYQQDFADRIPGDLAAGDANEWIIQQAAIWPDLARGFKGDGLKEKYHHGPWHYINMPTFLTDADEQALKDDVRAKLNLQFNVPDDPEAQNSMNVVQAIAQATTKWLEESDTLAVTVTYDSEVAGFLREIEQNQSNAEVPRLSLSESYLNRGGDTATRRLVQAGYRLGKLLNSLP
jgi:hypothetical protein